MQDKTTLLREKWAEALESGKYQQLRGHYFPIDQGSYDRESNTLCATALLWRVNKALGFNDKGTVVGTAVVRDINVRPGLVQIDNDNGLSFPKIAAKLRNGDYDVR